MSESDATSEQVIRVETRSTASGKIAIITLNRPHARNALNSALSTALPAALSESDADPAGQAIILTGSDPAFCAGFDLRDVGSGEKKGE
ncbi:MAG: enoyl-CoA hydratase/isomerase family protein, partial [Ilumatobacteraceae bacterium]|nr:enoyl-CoA hydratase/isomerase family protein [Ilumatobacteraceae bacterium]